MLQLFQRHVASGMFRVFQMFQRYVSSLFSERMLQVCLSGCCICFTHTLHVFYLDVAYGCSGFQVFFQVFSEVCFKCFNCLQTYVATIVFGCFKSRSDVASLQPPPSSASSLHGAGRASI